MTRPLWAQDGPFRIGWLDGKREPQCQPNPAYPTGVDCDLSLGAETTCSTMLPYPAPRCGVFIVECKTCGLRVGVTTAGRPDDPRSVKVACKQNMLIRLTHTNAETY